MNSDNKQRQERENETMSPHNGNGCVQQACKVISDLWGNFFLTIFQKLDLANSRVVRTQPKTGAPSKKPPPGPWIEKHGHVVDGC